MLSFSIMADPVSAFSSLCKCCQALCTGFDDFWLLAGLTDRSYEDGVKKGGFPKAVDAYVAAGLTGKMLKQVCNGVNGNLLALLKDDPDVCDPVRRTGEGQDLTFSNRQTGRPASVEVKLLFDCSQSKHYATTARDWDKLEKVRASGTSGDLFLVVFFHQMPNYDYPKRSGYLHHQGIGAQFAELRRYIDRPPLWPVPAPYTHLIGPPSAEVKDLLLKRWPPRIDWKLDLSAHLREAGVGVAIWQVP